MILEGLTLEEARRILLSLPITTDTECISIENCANRILARDYDAPMMLPSFSKSPLDGYALRSSDTKGASQDSPVTLRITEEIPAGFTPTKAVGFGEAVKILTGAPIPEGADVVCRYEDTVFSEESVTIFSEFLPDTNIIHAGEDVSLGQRIASQGTVITPALAGLFASLGIGKIDVYKIPRAAMISTGNELVSLDEALTAGKIYNSSLYTLSSYLLGAGIHIGRTALALDTDEAIAHAITQALPSSDLIVTTGGVSVGDYDRVRGALESLGAEILFWRITIKPGGALIAAVLQGKLILGLSGNPGSAAVALHLLGIPYIKRLCGRREILPQELQAYAIEGFPKASPCERYLRGHLLFKDGKVFFTQTGAQGNNIITSFVNCTALAKIPAGSGPVEAGSLIDVILL